MLIFDVNNFFLKIYVAVFISLISKQICILEANTITTVRSEDSGVTCENEHSSVFCESVVDSNSCPGPFEDESAFGSGCRKSCGLCHDENESSDEGTNQSKEVFKEKPLNTGGGCEDKIPNCSSYLSMCCSMKDAMNTSCAKTCKFCSETPVPPAAGAPGGIAAPTASTGQDPCSPTDPPSVTVDAPGAPGQTTTTQSPIGTIPGVSIDSSLPGQTTTTTQASITGPGSLPGNPVG